jgi:hypothetical protein
MVAAAQETVDLYPEKYKADADTHSPAAEHADTLLASMADDDAQHVGPACQARVPIGEPCGVHLLECGELSPFLTCC